MFQVHVFYIYIYTGIPIAIISLILKPLYSTNLTRLSFLLIVTLIIYIQSTVLNEKNFNFLVFVA